jgi:hypothetical protein
MSLKSLEPNFGTNLLAFQARVASDKVKAASSSSARRLRIVHADPRVRHLDLAERFLGSPHFKNREFWRFIEKLEASGRVTVGDLEHLTVPDIFSGTNVPFALQRRFFAVLEDSAGAVLSSDNSALGELRSLA